MEIVGAYSAWHWLHDDPGRTLKPPSIDRLQEITAPTQIVVGARDVPNFLDMANVLDQRIGRSRLAVLPNVGHMANMEAPAWFNRIVLEFLAEVAGRPRS